MKAEMPRRRAKGLWGLMFALPVTLFVAGLGGSPANAADYSVFVGYADNSRATATSFPSPWEGDPGVTFLGCTTASNGNTPCDFDASAVRIVNNTVGSITIDAVAVHVSTCTYALWSSSLPVTLGFGGQLILTQTVSGSTNGCSSDGRMDTSDVGPMGEDYAGICTPDGITPTVDVTEDVGGTPVLTMYSDTGQVINTGGFDLATCPMGSTNNESTQWTSIGSPSCGSSMLALTPLAQTHTDDGGKATVTASLTCSNTGAPLPGAPIDLAILSGPNAGLPFAPGITDANGNVSFTYADPIDRVGTDTLQASLTNLAGTFFSNDVTVAWVEVAAPAIGSPRSPWFGVLAMMLAVCGCWLVARRRGIRVFSESGGGGRE